MKNITLISGVMASGKSKMVFDLVDQFKDENKSYKLFIPECQTHIKSRAKKEILEAEQVHSAEQVINTKADFLLIDEVQFIPVHQLKKIVESDNKATLILVGLQKDLFNHEFKNYQYLKTVERIEHIRLHAECDFCKKAMADFSCCEKMGKNGSLLTDDGAVYKNTCVKCATERDII